MSIHEHLPPQARKQLKEVGWARGIELAKRLDQVRLGWVIRWKFILRQWKKGTLLPSSS
jgi:hypothetical protein